MVQKGTQILGCLSSHASSCSPHTGAPCCPCMYNVVPSSSSCAHNVISVAVGPKFRTIYGQYCHTWCKKPRLPPDRGNTKCDAPHHPLMHIMWHLSSSLTHNVVALVILSHAQYGTLIFIVPCLPLTHKMWHPYLPHAHMMWWPSSYSCTHNTAPLIILLHA